MAVPFTTPPRAPVIDAVKAVAAQLIVLHHLVSYGPLADGLDRAWPALSAWLYEHGRIAVQVFLVTAGYLAAPTLVRADGPPWRAIGRRYLRLVRPFAAAVLLTVAVCLLVRPWFADDMLPALPSLAQLLAHGLLLHGVLGVDSLSAGVWYVAIDFQLFVLLALLAWACRGLGLPLWVALSAGALLSLLVVNLDARWDNWAPYFFGAYGLGALAGLLRARRLLATALVLALGGVALAWDWRSRIALATTVAVLLVWGGQRPGLLGARADAVLRWLADRTYALFLTHFALLVLGNALASPAGALGPLAASVLALLLWAGAQGLAHLFHARVEQAPGPRTCAAHSPQHPEAEAALPSGSAAERPGGQVAQ